MAAELSDDDLYDPSFVVALFDEMASTYGLVNSISSFGFCYFWRKACARLVTPPPGAMVVDLMSGMSELSILLQRRAPSPMRILGVDRSSVMCSLAANQLRRRKLDTIHVVSADALRLGLPDGSVDTIVSSFGLKTFSTSQTRALAEECWRIARPNAELGFLEISVPPARALRLLYMFYLERVIPIVGRLLMGNPENYRLLGVYTRKFHGATHAAEAFRDAGFEVESRRFFFGCASGFLAKKPRSAVRTHANGDTHSSPSRPRDLRR